MHGHFQWTRNRPDFAQNEVAHQRGLVSQNGLSWYHFFEVEMGMQSFSLEKSASLPLWEEHTARSLCFYKLDPELKFVLQLWIRIPHAPSRRLEWPLNKLRFNVLHTGSYLQRISQSDTLYCLTCDLAEGIDHLLCSSSPNLVERVTLNHQSFVGQNKLTVSMVSWYFMLIPLRSVSPDNTRTTQSCLKLGGFVWSP